MRQIGPYEIQGELGRGCMGVVYRARDPASERDVAIKVMTVGAHFDVAQERFRREIAVTQHLRHANIIRVHDSGLIKGRPYLVMDLIEGESLQDLLDRRGPFEPREATELVATLARAVQHAHARRVVHRDIKPANVLRKTTGEVVLTDFGLSKVQEGASQLTRAGEALGTPHFMAPEQVAGDGGRVGPSSDVYALGATLFCLLTGRPPFPAGSSQEVFQRVLKEVPPPPSTFAPDVSAALDRICATCLRKDPGQRYASAGALAEDLAESLRPEREPLPVGPSRELLLVFAGTFLVLLLLAAVVAGVVLDSDAAPPVAPQPNVAAREAAPPRPKPSRPEPPPAKPTLRPRETPRLERLFDDGGADFAAATRIDFERDPNGARLRPGMDIGRTFVQRGITLETSIPGAFVSVNEFSVRPGRGLSCATHEPLWEGSLTIKFCVPGRPDVPAYVTRVGLWLAVIQPDGTQLEAHGPGGKVLKAIRTRREGREFLGLRSNVPIVCIRVVPNAAIDPDYSIDDLVFDRPRPLPKR